MKRTTSFIYTCDCISEGRSVGPSTAVNYALARSLRQAAAAMSVLAACQLGSCQPNVAVESSANSGARDAAIGSPANPQPPKPRLSEAPTLLVRLGQALVPLGCRIGENWSPGKDCLPAGLSVNLVLRLLPRLRGEGSNPSVERKEYFLPFSEQKLWGLAMRGSGDELDSGTPLLGFAAAGSSSVVRFSSFAAARIVDDAKSWCALRSTVCRGLGSSDLASLGDKPVDPRAHLAALSLVSQAIWHSVRETGGISEVRALYVQRHGETLTWLQASVATDSWTTSQSQALQLPPILYFIVEVGRKVPPRLVSLPSKDSLGMGEAGRIVGLVDLDADGVDEAILEWGYSEGRDLLYVLQTGDGLKVIGRFGAGT